MDLRIRQCIIMTGCLLSLLTLLMRPVHAAGLMTPVGQGLPELTLKEHHVDVRIEDGYAITTIDQTFSNPHTETLEAIYAFPVPDKASVGEFTYWIDGQAVTGEVVEKQRARTIYETEKAQGNAVALTEQDAYRTFDSKVYPVLPQSEVKIRLKYFQTAQTDSGIGRYVYPLEDGGVDEQTMAFWIANTKVSHAFSFNLRMRSSYPIEDFRLPQHPQAAINKLSDQEWEVSFGSGASNQQANKSDDAVINESAGAQPSTPPSTPQPNQQLPAHTLDKDIVVYWRHQQGLPGTVDMVSYRAPNSDQGTFMLTLTPGDDLGALQTGRDWLFVLDVSGSMQTKYAALVDGVIKGMNKLSQQDRFRIITFNDRARELTSGYVTVNAENITRYGNLLKKRSPSGGTDLYSGLEKGIRGLDADRPSAVFLVTDGVANVGTTEKKQFLTLLEKADVRLFCFVMGNSANKPLLEGMTRVSNGFSMNISNGDDILGRILQAASKLSHEAYRDINLKVTGGKVTIDNVTPANIGSLYRGQQLTIFGHYRGDGDAKLTIQGKVGAEKREYVSPLHFPNENTLNPEIERLWAFATIEALQHSIDYFDNANTGENTDRKEAIVDLAKEYGLVTDYTSLIVMREEQFQQQGIQRNNQQRIQRETDAAKQRSTQPVRNHRQDTQSPAFQTPRPAIGGGSGNGGGAFGPWSLLVLLSLLFVAKRSRRLNTESTY